MRDEGLRYDPALAWHCYGLVTELFKCWDNEFPVCVPAKAGIHNPTAASDGSLGPGLRRDGNLRAGVKRKFRIPDVLIERYPE
jgi:hypothetical protein